MHVHTCENALTCIDTPKQNILTTEQIYRWNNFCNKRNQNLKNNLGTVGKFLAIKKMKIVMSMNGRTIYSSQMI